MQEQITTNNNSNDEDSDTINLKRVKDLIIAIILSILVIYFRRLMILDGLNADGNNSIYEIENMFQIKNLETDGEIIITNIRHKNQIEYAINNIDEAMNAVKNNLPIDIISISIKQTLEDLGKITGENVSEDIINEIFSKFCLGK